MLTAMDYLSKWAEVKALKRVDSKGIADFVYDYICCRFEIPLELLTNSDLGFRGEVMHQLCQKLNRNHKYVTPNHLNAMA